MLDFIKSRNTTIDLLRFIGLSLIILAHVKPTVQSSELLFQLRIFDVPLMLFISGLAYSGRKADFSAQFFIKRIKRLVIPVYIFLTAYFIAVFIARLAGIDFGVRVNHVVGSYLLMEGIGYVWVIRVFLIISMLTPCFLLLDRKIRSNSQWCLIMVGTLIVDELLITNGVGVNSLFVREFVYYGIGYGLMFFLGLRYRHFSGSLKAAVFAVVALGFAGLQFIEYRPQMGGVISPFKYPPRAMFLLYGAAMSILVATLAKKLTARHHVPKWMLFIGQNTIWIYLYHIPLIQLTGMVAMPWGVRYLIVYMLAAFAVYVQNLIVNRFKFPYSGYFVG